MRINNVRFLAQLEVDDSFANRPHQGKPNTKKENFGLALVETADINDLLGEFEEIKAICFMDFLDIYFDRIHCTTTVLYVHLLYGTGISADTPRT
jgi:hypothetical protein